jgi:MoxR-like ATPase
MSSIVQVHHPDIERELLAGAIEAFYRLRATAGLRKPPSTSELVDWISALRHSGIPAEQLLGAKLPFLGTLLKKEQDLAAVEGEGRRRG